MAETKKITKSQMFERIAEICAEHSDIVEFCNKERAMLAKKSTRENPVKVADDKAIVELVLSELARIGEPVTVTDLMNSSEAIQDYRNFENKPLSNQKITNVLTELTADKKVVRVQDKRKAFFSVV